ncbi:C-20 methyltransferase BchU [Chloroherpeton thalassium ATCC 35110]|uniref:C-20 methyltransferase BchU n=1 Tax=Chloroherpeton thalassium (strain ATCC 35110 / GB-78) TaxID=517418 RepID=B3QS14_CHLT3|nr:C-20 methyltransferase BchU [Chloroherpeton thalassium]ACF13959.1 C-20 methyltransferase BchU [Chloroherpeton thalassium ATCC 35110]
MNDTELLRATDRAYDMVFKGLVEFSCVKAGFELDLFNILADAGSMELEPLAEKVGGEARRLGQLLVAMEQIGLVEKDGSKWKLTEFSDTLFAKPENHPSHTMESAAHSMGFLAENYYMKLADAVRGKQKFISPVAYPPQTREENEYFETIHRRTAYFPIKILGEFAKLDGIKQMTDVGGGIGDISASLCQKFPELNVTLLNLPGAIELVNENAASKGVGDRLKGAAVDIYKEPFPEGDAVMFCRMLYPMSVQFSTMMIKKAYDAIRPGGRILILDMLICDPNKPNFDYLSHYLCGIGMDFSVLDFKKHAEYPGILEGIGFTDVTKEEKYDHVLYQAVKPA